jgi:hypothetical protein
MADLFWNSNLLNASSCSLQESPQYYKFLHVQHNLVLKSSAGPIGRVSKASTVFDLSNTGIVASNSLRGMDVCSRFSVLCCPVYVEALRRADPQGVLPNVQNRFINFRT